MRGMRIDEYPILQRDAMNKEPNDYGPEREEIQAAQQRRALERSEQESQDWEAPESVRPMTDADYAAMEVATKELIEARKADTEWGFRMLEKYNGFKRAV